MAEEMHFDKYRDTFTGRFSFLSNLYPCTITMPDGIIYKSAEAAFQAQKCEGVERRLVYAKLRGIQAKKLGRRARVASDWHDRRIDVMREVIHAKFDQNPDLAERLVSVTGDIVANNHWGDSFWGKSSRNYCGYNHLGILLMEEREKLKLVQAMTPEETAEAEDE
jgi:ribA/ribD-fused uncharacterized protein